MKVLQKHLFYNWHIIKSNILDNTTVFGAVSPEYVNGIIIDFFRFLNIYLKIGLTDIYQFL